MNASSGLGANVDSGTATAPAMRRAEDGGDGLGAVAHEDGDAVARLDAVARARALATRRASPRRSA